MSEKKKSLEDISEEMELISEESQEILAGGFSSLPGGGLTAQTMNLANTNCKGGNCVAGCGAKNTVRGCGSSEIVGVA